MSHIHCRGINFSIAIDCLTSEAFFTIANLRCSGAGVMLMKQIQASPMSNKSFLFNKMCRGNIERRLAESKLPDGPEQKDVMKARQNETAKLKHKLTSTHT